MDKGIKYVNPKTMGSKAKRTVLREASRNAAAFLFVVFLLVVLFFLCGGSIDGLLYGHWPPDSDHPTNQEDTNPN